MAFFTAYNPASGVIQFSGSVPDDQMAYQVFDGLATMEGASSHDKHYVLDGVICAYTESELTAKASLPRGWIWQMPERVAVDARTLAEVKSRHITAMNAACQAQIIAGFHSSVLGSDHLYPAKMTDQANLSASVVSSLIPELPAEWVTPFWCADSEGTWGYHMHTATQIQQVGQDGKAAIVAALVQNQVRRDQIDTATTIAAVEAIAWDA